MKRNRMNSSIVIAGITGAVVFSLGLLIGHFAINHSSKKTKNVENAEASFYFKDSISKKILSEINSKNIENELRFLSSKPHLAGTERDLELANYIKNLWVQQGLDKAELVPYDFLLSFPSTDKENKVEIIEEDGTPVFTSRSKEILNGKPTEMVQAYLSHTPAGVVSGDLVFVNYGRLDDFAYLESIGISVKDKICIAKYGKIFRGNKVANAAARGASGVILYLDPVDVAQNGTNPDDLYPNTLWLPGDGIQRGGVLLSSGDPLTPGYPCLERAYRYPKEVCGLPQIPAQPIGYNDAEKLLRILGGNPVPVSWKGGLNITYRTGPGFNLENAERKCRITTYNKDEITTSNNVIGWIKGSLEPDRYVLVGNHRDGWGYGALDPSSGTAVILELSRVFGNLLKQGLRPKRSLVFCNWAAEEPGVMGSTEWVEENFQKLFSRAVVYLNVDIAVMGTIFEAEGSPMLAKAIMEVANMVPHPELKGKTLYDGWADYYRDLDGSTKPRISFPGSGTDHVGFYFYTGVPSATFTFALDQRKYGKSTYPAYHTAYDTFDYMTKFFDPKFVYHQAMGKFLGILAHYFTDSLIIPYNLSDYSQKVKDGLQRLNAVEMKASLSEHVMSLSFLEEAVSTFGKAGDELHQHIKSMNFDNLLTVRKINDQLLMTERCFIKMQGLPGRPLTRKLSENLRSAQKRVLVKETSFTYLSFANKLTSPFNLLNNFAANTPATAAAMHLLFSPSQLNNYAQSEFAVLYDSLYGIENLNVEDKLETRRRIEEYLSDLTIAFQSAASFIDPDFAMQKR